jgi:hypothetical protein
LLSWTAEWDLHHELRREDGRLVVLDTNLPGYMLDAPALWLDSTRVLFTVVATGPRGGEPEYRESGWRGDLALLELHRSRGSPADSAPDSFRRVTDVPDGQFLRPTGLLNGQVLCADGTLIDPRLWRVTAIDLPPGIAYGAGSTVVVAGDSVLLGAARSGGRAPGATTSTFKWQRLGASEEPPEPPAISADGRLVAVRVVRAGRPVVVIARLE